VPHFGILDLRHNASLSVTTRHYRSLKQVKDAKDAKTAGRQGHPVDALTTTGIQRPVHAAYARLTHCDALARVPEGTQNRG
jgi:hypothetical protein